MSDFVQLGDICEFIRGVSFDPSDVRQSSRDGFVPILRAGNIREELDTVHDLIFVPEKRLSRDQYFRVNDIAICMSSGSAAIVGKTAQLRQPFSGSVGAFCGIIRPRDSIVGKYIAHWLHSPEFLNWRDIQARGANIQNLRFSQLEQIRVPLPPLPEQQRIAALLDRADHLRRTRRYAQQLSDSFLQAVFVEMFGDPVDNEMDWKVTELRQISRQITDGTHVTPTYVESGVPFISTIHVSEHGIDWSRAKRITREEYEALNRRVNPQIGDILYTKVGSVGLAVPVLDDRPFSIFVQLGLIKLYSEKCDFRFLTQHLNTPSFRNRILARITGATMKYIGIGDIGELKIILPPLPLQQKFAHIVQQFERLRAQQREAERQAEHLFQTLLQRAFSGALSKE